jgi:YidC/Oxa1 family membrane protein insertase
MFDGLFDLVSTLLNFFYELIPDYAAAIALLTLAIMVVTTPLTLKSTRSMIEMQRLQPELRRLQQQYKDDRQKLQEAQMAFFQEHGINPLGGCLPMLLQMPVFIILFNVINGLTRIGRDDTFDPKYLDHGSALYDALDDKDEMLSFGVDLAKSASEVLGEDIVRALPYLLMVVVVGAMSLYQQKQIQGRSSTPVAGPQKMITRLFTVIFVLFAFVSPAALVVYFVVSTAWRVLQQAYITRSLYGGDDSPGAQAAQAMKELREDKETSGGGFAGIKDALSLPQRGDRGSTGGPNGSKRPKGRSDQADGAETGEPGPTSRTSSRPHSRSKKKRKRR